jgi:carboxylesterase
MRLIGEGLAERGFAVKGIRLPGHGTRPEDMKNVSWQDWLREARLAAREMQKKYRYFSVGGLSMGGLLSLILAQETDVTACVPIAAPIRIFNPFRRLALVMAPFIPELEWPSKRNQVYDPDSYNIGYRRYPTRSAHDLSVLMDKAEKDLSLIHAPVLCVQSKGDKTVRPESPQMILEGISSEHKAMLWLETSPHVCTVYDEKDKIIEAMDVFLRKAESI